ncbi:MAG: hypothetical protein AAGA96_13960, partial [Verrucomicrobiota bacterium]
MTPRAPYRVWIPLLASTAFLCTAIVFLSLRFESPSTRSGGNTPGTQSDPVAPSPVTARDEVHSSLDLETIEVPAHGQLDLISQSFEAWLDRWTNRDPQGPYANLELEGRELAIRRTEALRKLMRADPETALRNSLRWDQWDTLPESVKEVSERPFSAWSSQESHVYCDQETDLFEHELWMTTDQDVEARAWSYGRRKQPMSRSGIPQQGFVLGNEAALWSEPLRLISDPETRAVEQRFPSVTGSREVSAWTGEPLDPDSALVTLMAGRVVRVAGEREYDAMQSRLQAWEDRPGPDGGVAELAAWLEQAEGEDFIPLSEALPSPPIVNAWTETPKRLLMMMVDFDNLTGPREDYATLLAKLSNDVSPLIDEMSFGKTNLIITIVPNVIRMPQPSNYYPDLKAAGGNANRELHDHAQAGAIALGYNMDDYDFLCVQFKSIGMGYGGLANLGGKKSWIQSSGTGVFVHEYGHNYGVGHASRWIPDPGEAPFSDLGTNQEYGGGSSIMGGGPFPQGHFDSQAKARLSWLNENQWTDVTSSGTYRLYRADHRSSPNLSQVGALRVERSDGTGDALWLGYKRTIENRRRLSRGIQVLWQKASKLNKNWLVRAGRLGSFSSSDYELPVGQTFSDLAGGSGIHITPLKRG